MAAVRLPQLPPSGLRNSASAPALLSGRRQRKPDFADLAEEDGQHEARGLDALQQPLRPVPADAALWLPALRPLTGCASGAPKLCPSWAAESFSTARSGAEAPLSTNRSTVSKASVRTMRKSASSGKLQKGRLAADLSNAAAEQNQRAQRSLCALAEQRPAGMPMMMKLGSSGAGNRGSLFSTSDALDEQGFAAALGDLDRNMAGLKDAMASFDPSKAGDRGAKGDSGDKGEDRKVAISENERERRMERFEAYKMSRKFDPDPPPPLTRGPVDEALPPKSPRDQTIVERNTKADALACWSPQQRRMRLDAQRANRVVRSEEVIQRSKRMEEAACEMYARELEKKAQRGQAARLDRHRATPTPKLASVQLMAAHWMKTIVIARAAKRLKDIADNKKKHRSMKEVFRMTVDLTSGGAEGGTEVQSPFKILGEMVKLRSRVQEARGHAKVCYGALCQWRLGGNIFIKVKQIALFIRVIQRWWRTRSKVLRDVREGMKRRFERIEREEILKEHARRFPQQGQAPAPRSDSPSNKAGRGGNAPTAARSVITRAPPIPGMRRGSKSRHLTADDYVQMERLPDEVLNKFMTMELRAARYFILPRIEQWEQEVHNWHLEVGERLDDRCVRAGMGVGKSDSAGMFRWPPVRPSHLPPEHPNHEGWWCPGRKGDEIVLDMVKRAREAYQRLGEAGGWREIPSRKAEKAEQKRAATPQRSPSRKSTFRTSFLANAGRSSLSLNISSPNGKTSRRGAAGADGGEITDEELKAWGGDGSDLPGLSEVTSGPPEIESP